MRVLGHTRAVNAVLPIARVAVSTEPDFAALYDETVHLTWRMLVRLGVAATDVEDAVQDVFVIAHRRLATLRPDIKTTTWVGGIAVRVAHDYRRRAQRKPVEALEPYAATLEDLRARPDDAAVRSQAADLVQRMLEQLEATQREVYVLAELERWSAAEIAAHTGAQLNTVYSRLRLARARMAELVLALQRGAP